MFKDSSADLAGRRILIVENEHDVASRLAAAVREAGGRVAGPVPDGEAVMRILDEQDGVDAAILDVRIGNEGAAPIAKILEARGVSVIFVTGYDNWFIPDDGDDVPVYRDPMDAEHIVRILFDTVRKDKG